MKRIVLLLLAVALLLSLAAGCGKEPEPQQTSTLTPAAQTPGAESTPEPAETTPEDVKLFPLEETFEMSMWTTMVGSNLSWMVTLNDHPVHKELEKLTNVHVEFLHPPANEQRENFTLIIVSGEYPDVFLTIHYATGHAGLYTEGVSLALNDYIPEYMPNYNAIINSDPKMLRDIKLDTGEIVTINRLFYTPSLQGYGMIMRKDILDKNGYSIPDTISEWEAVLSGYRDYGLEKPLYIANNGTTMDFFESTFGVGSRLYFDGDKIKYGPAEPGYKDYLATMRDWYGKDLIDKEFHGNTGWNAPMGYPNKPVTLSGTVVGAHTGFADELGTQIADSGGTEITDMNYTVPNLPVLNKGDKPNFNVRRDPERVSYGFGISSTITADRLPTILQYIDFMYDEANMPLLNYRIEGVSFEYGENGHPQFTSIISPSSYDGINTFYTYDYSACFFPFLEVDQAIKERRPQDVIELQKKWVVYDATMGVIPVTVTLTAEEISAASAILNDINTYADEMTVKFITGEESLDKYDEFLSMIKQMRLEEALELYQAAFDRYLTR